MSGARFVGVGVGQYDGSFDDLVHAVPEVQRFAGLLDGRFSCTVLTDPKAAEVRAVLEDLPGSMPGAGSLVVLWSGHGIPSPAELRLMARDSKNFKASGLGAASEVAAACAESGAGQILLIIDTCFSGEAVWAGTVAAQILQESPPAGGRAWVGVLTSCLSVETARDGAFGPRLAALLNDGPQQAELRVRWSPHNAFIRGDDLCDALLKDWERDQLPQSPDFLSRGSAWWMFANPLYDPGAPEQVVEHLLLAARGGAVDDERSWFTGRAVEVEQVAAWVRSRRPGMHVITGSAGTGKTAIAGRVVSLSNPDQRAVLLDEGVVLGADDPGERSVTAHVHARGLTADRAAGEIGAQLVRAGVLTAQADQRNAAELVGQLQRAVEAGAAAPVIVADGLDEARGEAFAIATDLLARLAPYATVIVSTREVRRGGNEPSLLGALDAGDAVLDLDDPAAQGGGRADLRAYLARRLAGVHPKMDSDAVGKHMARRTSMITDEPFLLARLVADQLWAVPVDTSRLGWEELVSDSVGEAFDADLARVGSGADGTIAGRPAVQAARNLLGALTWGLGAGLPEDEWLACANADGSGGEFGRDDVSWVLDELGRYIVQDGEDGTAVYRVAHQALADHVRRSFTPTRQQPFDPQAGPIATALLGRYAALLAQKVPAQAPAYLWRYAWRHAADAGLDGLRLLRDVADGEPALLPDVALTASNVALQLSSRGYREDAVAPAEEAVRLRREQAAANPAYLPDLAMTLYNLGVRYSEVGRRHDAVVPTKEAVSLYREQAAANPAYLPDLARTLNSLEAGRVGDDSPICPYCRHRVTPGSYSCPLCGAPAEIRVTDSGWMGQPMIQSMTRIRCGKTRVQIAGTLTPVAEFDLAPDDWIYFAPHALLWADAATTLTAAPVPPSYDPAARAGYDRRPADLPRTLLEGHGPGHIGVSENHAGELIAVPLTPGQSVHILQHQFLCATGSVSYQYLRSPIHYRKYVGRGGGREYEYPSGRYHYQFTASRRPGLLLLHAAGNVFVRDLAENESILVESGSPVYWEESVQISMHLEYARTTPAARGRRDPGSRRMIWLRLGGPGRVAVQSVHKPAEETGIPDFLSFPSVKRW